MSGTALPVVHVVSADIPPWKLGVLEALRAARPAAVVHVGRLGPPSALPPPAARLRAPFDLGWLGARRLRQALAKLVSGPRPARHAGAPPTVPPTGTRAADPPLLLHVWSPAALAWCLPLTAAARGADGSGPRPSLLVETDAGPDLGTLARRYLSRPAPSRIGLACPTALVRRRLVENGVSAADCVVIRPFVDFAAINRPRRQVVRARLELEPAHAVILALPPVVPGSGTFQVAWAGLLASKVLPNVRLLIPGVGREAERVERLVHSIDHRQVVRFARQRLSWPELLAASDVAAYLPAADAPLSGLVWAMAAARPIVASAVPAVAELLAQGHNAWLCRPADPGQAAARLLLALQAQPQSRHQAEIARGQAFRAFGRQRMIRQYHLAYENLAAGRRVAEGIADSATIS